jgi:hypothetical protein
MESYTPIWYFKFTHKAAEHVMLCSPLNPSKTLRIFYKVFVSTNHRKRKIMSGPNHADMKQTGENSVR